MATMSIGKAWEQTVPFVAREAALLFPVALLFVALPGLILQEMTPPQLQAWFAQPNPQTVPDVPAGFGLAMLVGMLIMWFGSLTLFALALRPGISVGEALRLSAARLPVLIGTAALVVGIILLAVIGAALVGALLSVLSAQAVAAIGLLVGLLGVAVMLFLSIRLVLLNAVIIDTSLGVVASLKSAWALTRGHFWRLLAFLIGIMLLSSIAGTAAQVVVGLIGGLVAGPDGARLAGGIAAAAVSSVVQVYLLVMLARLYRQAAG